MRAMRRLILAMVLALSFSLLVPAVPAQADHKRGHFCVTVGFTLAGPIRECWDLPLPTWNVWWIFDDCRCDPAFDPKDEWLDPKIRQDYLHHLGQAVAYMTSAALAQDPEQIKELRGMATQAMLQSSEALGGAEVYTGQVGWIDRDNDKFHEDSNQYLVASSEHTVAALHLFQGSLGDPKQQPDIEAGLEQLDKAAKLLIELNAY